MITPNQIMASSTVMPGTKPGRIFSATGASSGIMMKAISKKSMKHPRMNTRMFTTIKKPHAPPGMPVNRCSTQMCPSAALNVKLNTVEPIKMNSTNEASFAVFSSACLSSVMLMRPLPSAKINAPSAPIAPPSVGVATPRKMVPNTRKIKISGGINTKVTCSASFDKRPMRVTRLMMASDKPSSDASVIDKITISSPAAGMGRCSRGVNMELCTLDHANPATAHSKTRASKDL